MTEAAGTWASPAECSVVTDTDDVLVAAVNTVDLPILLQVDEGDTTCRRPSATVGHLNAGIKAIPTNRSDFTRR
jgi:hypothetical protein